MPVGSFYFSDFFFDHYNFIICWIYRSNVCLQSHPFVIILSLNSFPILNSSFSFRSSKFDNRKKNQPPNNDYTYLLHISTFGISPSQNQIQRGRQRERETHRHSHEDILHIVSNDCIDIYYYVESNVLQVTHFAVPSDGSTDECFEFYHNFCQRYHDLYSLICLQFCHFQRSHLLIATYCNNVAHRISILTMPYRLINKKENRSTHLVYCTW